MANGFTQVLFGKSAHLIEQNAGHFRHADQAVEVADRLIRVPEVAGILLDQVRRFAEKHLGETVRHCVIAVPAYFNEVQK
ncbi:MAG: Hsp70 family protein, partial [Myxococcota bacterium]